MNNIITIKNKYLQFPLKQLQNERLSLKVSKQWNPTRDIYNKALEMAIRDKQAQSKKSKAKKPKAKSKSSPIKYIGREAKGRYKYALKKL